MVVGGTVQQPTVGILDERQRGVDLRHCGICTPGIQHALPVLADFIASAGLMPYDVRQRRGELKYVLVTESPDGELMVRFVLRSEGQLPRLRDRLGEPPPGPAAGRRGHREPAARAQGRDRGGPGGRAHGAADPADAPGAGDDAPAPAELLPDEHVRRDAAVRAGVGVDRRGRPGLDVGPVLRRRRVRAARRTSGSIGDRHRDQPRGDRVREAVRPRGRPDRRPLRRRRRHRPRAACPPRYRPGTRRRQPAAARHRRRASRAGSRGPRSGTSSTPAATR